VRIPVKLMNRTYCVYILSNSNQTLYTGVTSDLVRRVIAHRLGVGSRFTKRHGLHSLVWYESTNYVWSALEREKQIKSWKRKRKLALIKSMNPSWSDLSPTLGLPAAVDR
jgi:putative endonuclease